jgi:Bacterial PH domain
MTKRRAGKVLSGNIALEPDESVITVERPSRVLVLPKYLLTLGLYGIWRKREISAVTNHRLMLGRGVLSRDERSIPLKRVEDVSFSRRWVSSYADVAVRGRRGTENIRIGPLTARKARSMTAEIEKNLL